MAVVAQARHDLAADEAGSANNNDLHSDFSIRGDALRVADGAR
jgi:hypothetical protein